MLKNDMTAWVRNQIEESVRVHQAAIELTPLLISIGEKLVASFRSGKRVYFFGNGGSAADAQHWAAELSGRFYLDRPSLPAIALNTNTSQVTAIANDYSYDEIFSRPLSGLIEQGDTVVAISTSGNSKNVVLALELARRKHVTTIGFTGAAGGLMKPLCDGCVCIQTSDVARIQEAHELCGHIICAFIERELFDKATVGKKDESG